MMLLNLFHVVKRYRNVPVNKNYKITFIFYIYLLRYKFANLWRDHAFADKAASGKALTCAPINHFDQSFILILPYH